MNLLFYVICVIFLSTSGVRATATLIGGGDFTEAKLLLWDSPQWNLKTNKDVFVVANQRSNAGYDLFVWSADEAQVTRIAQTIGAGDKIAGVVMNENRIAWGAMKASGYEIASQQWSTLQQPAGIVHQKSGNYGVRQLWLNNNVLWHEETPSNTYSYRVWITGTGEVKAARQTDQLMVCAPVVGEALHMLSNENGWFIDYKGAVIANYWIGGGKQRPGWTPQVIYYTSTGEWWYIASNAVNGGYFVQRGWKTTQVVTLQDNETPGETIDVVVFDRYEERVAWATRLSTGYCVYTMLLQSSAASTVSCVPAAGHYVKQIVLSSTGLAFTVQQSSSSHVVKAAKFASLATQKTITTGSSSAVEITMTRSGSHVAWIDGNSGDVKLLDAEAMSGSVVTLFSHNNGVATTLIGGDDVIVFGVLFAVNSTAMVAMQSTTSPATQPLSVLDSRSGTDISELRVSPSGKYATWVVQTASGFDVLGASAVLVPTTVFCFIIDCVVVDSIDCLFVFFNFQTQPTPVPPTPAPPTPMPRT
jgi:hypothetical protein